jgi:hypothetical protein
MLGPKYVAEPDEKVSVLATMKEGTTERQRKLHVKFYNMYSSSNMKVIKVRRQGGAHVAIDAHKNACLNYQGRPTA